MVKIYIGTRFILISDKIKEFNLNNTPFVEFRNNKSLIKAFGSLYNDSKILSIGIFGNPDEVINSLKSSIDFIYAAGGIVFNSKNEILLIQRNGYWDLPKGKIEDGETPEENALREVEEECGIKSHYITDFKVKTFHSYIHKAKVVIKETFWFNMGVKSNENMFIPQEKEGITQVKWVKIKHLSTYGNDTYASIKDIFNRVKFDYGQFD